MKTSGIRGKESRINRRVWGDPIGKLKDGENVYRSILGHYWVEDPARKFSNPTEAEMEEIGKIVRSKE